jgi:hypothetical protein
MSLDIDLTEMKEVSVWRSNITHNLGAMAEKAGVYKYIWHPEELFDEIASAGDLIPHLKKGLAELLRDPELYKQYNPPNGWGSYDYLVKFLVEYTDACRLHPLAKIVADR